MSLNYLVNSNNYNGYKTFKDNIKLQWVYFRDTLAYKIVSFS